MKLHRKDSHIGFVFWCFSYLPVYQWKRFYLSAFFLPSLLLCSFLIIIFFGHNGGKALMQQSLRKEKLEKVGLCLIKYCLIKLFKMIINDFLFSRSFYSQDIYFFRILVCSSIFAFRYQEIEGKYEKRKLRTFYRLR